MTIALFFGSTTGNTEDIAERIKNQLSAFSKVHLFDIASTPFSEIINYKYLIFGIPTWDYGELQSDWEDIWDDINHLDLTGKVFACFGCGDQVGYPEWYQDAMGLLHDKLVKLGGTPAGYWPATDYNFEASKAINTENNKFIGLPIDEDNQHELTDKRIKSWCYQLQKEFL